MRSHSSPFQAPEAGWIAYYLFYHEDRDRALLHYVSPVLKDLWRDGKIGSFFFVRYTLGGPHLRLRVRVSPNHREETAALLESTAAEFLARHPSKTAWSEDKVLSQNAQILANAGHEGEEEDGIYSDNSFLAFPVRFEVERYGGPGLIGASLDFFAVSSVTALRFLAAHTGRSSGGRLPGIFRILTRQAFGLSRDVDEILDLVEYAREFWPYLALLSSRGDQVFEAQRETFRRLVAAEISALGKPTPEMMAAQRLAQETASAETGTRRRILKSQMHMSANRLGLLNPEEVYLGRLLWRALHDLAESEPALWSKLRDNLISRREEDPEMLQLADLPAIALSDWFGPVQLSPYDDPAEISRNARALAEGTRGRPA